MAKYSVFRSSDPRNLRENGDYVKGPYVKKERAHKVAERLAHEHGGAYVVDDHDKGPVHREFKKWLYGKGHDMSVHGQGQKHGEK